ncbi:hypothetical protein [Pseudomonas sp. LRF_L74]|uniref:hypothetical protein n=1 Tax=Pseudomonas sp. LRF_L74 TaxID=3369422 RepID=UPI003F62F6A8
MKIRLAKAVILLACWMLVPVLASMIALLVAGQGSLIDTQWRQPLGSLQAGLQLWRMALYSAVAVLWFDVLRRTQDANKRKCLLQFGAATSLLIAVTEHLNA